MMSTNPVNHANDREWQAEKAQRHDPTRQCHSRFNFQPVYAILLVIGNVPRKIFSQTTPGLEVDLHLGHYAK